MNTRILSVVTSLRVGEGSAVGAVDLPLVRERHTGWPVVPGSSIKGALRERARFLGRTSDEVEAAFGPPPERDEGRPGTVRLESARLLALPVRSLTGCFALLTCPFALARLARECELPDPPNVPTPTPDRVLVGEGFQGTIEASGVTLESDMAGLTVLEEGVWAVRSDEGVTAWSEWIGQAAGKADLPLKQLAVAHDDVFSHAARYWTPSRPRAAIGADGVVEDGKLFWVESLPPETLLWLRLEPGESGDAVLPGEGEAFVLGGHRTTGCGRVTWHWRQG